MLADAVGVESIPVEEIEVGELVLRGSAESARSGFRVAEVLRRDHRGTHISAATASTLPMFRTMNATRMVALAPS